MSQVLERSLIRARQDVPATGTPSGRTAADFVDPLLLIVLTLAAVLLRLPYLWDIPRFTDELQEISWSLSIARGERLPLTAVDSYYGPLWSYLLALLFKLVGFNELLPRLAALATGVALVVLTYLFARDLAGRPAAVIAAGLVATSGGHIVINSHTARSNSLTPVLTTALIWLLIRALEPRRWTADGRIEPRTPDPRMLVPVGFLLGLALQTHISVIALCPALGAYALWRGRQLLLTPWPYASLLAVLAGYANMILFNLQTGFWSFRHASSLQQGYTDGRATDLTYYSTNLASLVQSLSRLLSGTIDSPDYPVRWLYVALAILGLALIARRGGALLLLCVASVTLVLPYFNPRYGPILSGRYLVPLLPLCFCAIGYLTIVAVRRITPARGLHADRRRGLVAAALGAALVLQPLAPLAAYYQEVVEDGRTNQPMFRLLSMIVTSRQDGEMVLLDEGLAQEALGAGGTDLKAYQMLLAAREIPYEVAKVSEADEHLPAAEPSILVLMEVKKRSSLHRSLRATVLGDDVESASGSNHRYAVFRITRR